MSKQHERIHLYEVAHSTVGSDVRAVDEGSVVIGPNELDLLDQDHTCLLVVLGKLEAMKKRSMGQDIDVCTEAVQHLNSIERHIGKLLNRQRSSTADSFAEPAQRVAA